MIRDATARHWGLLLVLTLMSLGGFDIPAEATTFQFYPSPGGLGTSYGWDSQSRPWKHGEDSPEFDRTTRRWGSFESGVLYTDFDSNRDGDVVHVRFEAHKIYTDELGDAIVTSGGVSADIVHSLPSRYYQSISTEYCVRSGTGSTSASFAPFPIDTPVSIRYVLTVEATFGQDFSADYNNASVALWGKDLTLDAAAQVNPTLDSRSLPPHVVAETVSGYQSGVMLAGEAYHFRCVAQLSGGGGIGQCQNMRSSASYSITLLLGLRIPSQARFV